MKWHIDWPEYSRYGEKLGKIKDDEICKPKYNSIEGNLYCHLKDPWIDAKPAEITEWGSEATDNTPCNGV